MRAITTRRSLLATLAGSVFVPGFALAQDEFDRAGLKGAGSTFVYPLAARWVQEYRHHLAGGIRFAAPNTGLDDDMNGVALDYEPVGSSAGIQRLRANAVDFALSEIPLSSDALRRQRLLQFPIVLGSIAVAANLPGVAPGALRLTGPVLADIELGKLKRWSDPAIRALNPQLQLPDAEIRLVHRSDGSGSTFTLTSYLAGQSAEWQRSVGADAQVKWPAGTGVRGSSGMVEAIRRTPHALGYLDEVQARQARLTTAALQNAAGRFVAPGATGAAAAAQSAAWNAAADFNEVLVDARGEGAYPIVASVFGLMSDRLGTGRNQRTMAFFDWALVEGRAAAEQLGYVPLPITVVGKVRDALSARSGAAQ
ncbi:phosphate ABC transporter substrate-binding protein PstS [Pseudorhodoferax sp.]|uniref:phosphate ABC transporter substrate-binding protein PstS n=1 Tax=Pseudorhodoferax sp. TaxID=1993553 RepID=UPI002DD62781|nr:phosphate ABC transporter substrate-binding protein PstS [Pseudorhodoferax sp.]